MRRRYHADPALSRKRKRELRQVRGDEIRQYEHDHRAINREHYKAYQREWRKRHLEKYRRQDAERNKKSYRRGRKTLDAWYANGCVVCGCYIKGAMHAHHRDPMEKDDCVSQLCCRRGDALRAELGKCDQFCANHHCALHHRMRNGDNDVPYDELILRMRAEWRDYIFEQAERAALRIA